MQTKNRAIKKILLVEDDAQEAELALAALAKQNLSEQVFVVRDGAEALDYLYCKGAFIARAPGNPVVVLLDNKMPKVTGLEVLKIIKADEKLKWIPVVALTSSRETTDLTGFYQHGVNAYVVKPMDYSEFMKTIEQLGVFWAEINETPPDAARAKTAHQNGEVIST